MGKIVNTNIATGKMPLTHSDNRPENFLVEVPGIVVPECEKIIFGLLNSKYGKNFSTIRNMNIFDPKKLYYQYAYYTAKDLLFELSNDEEKKSLENEEYIKDVLDDIHSHFFYVPCSETMMRHAILETMYIPFAKSLTYLFNHEIRDIDKEFLYSIIPPGVVPKFYATSGNLLDILKENMSKSPSEFTYTTIVTNSISDVLSAVEDTKTYNTRESTFLLRNHSENMIMKKEENSVTGKEEVVFKEKYTKEVLEKIVILEKGIPNSANRFGRFEPILFNPDI